MIDIPQGSKVNLGSGWKPLPGFVNIDLHYAADINADLRTIDIRPESASLIVSSHTIEHLAREDGVSLVGRCFSWLEPGGRIIFEFPDRDKCLKIAKRLPLQAAKGLLGGRSQHKKEWHEWLVSWAERGCDLAEPVPARWNVPGENHVAFYNAIEMSILFRSVGFDDILIEHPSFHGGRSWRDSRVTGRKDKIR